MFLLTTRQSPDRRNPLAKVYLMDEALHGSGLGMRILIFYVSTSRKPFAPLWEYFLFQVLSDVILWSCACVMPASNFGSLEIWILFSLPCLVDLRERALLLSGSHLVWVWVNGSFIGFSSISCGGLVWALCVSMEGCKLFCTYGIIPLLFPPVLMHVLKSIVGNDWTWLYWPCVILFGTWVPFSLILSYCVLVIS